jgi:ATP-binding cassette subfamily F protein 3
MNLIQLINGTKQIGSKTLFNQAYLSINDDEHVGLIGANGAGKTTLFKILAGFDELDSGQLVKSTQLKVGYLQQESDWDVDLTVEQFLSAESRVPIWEIKKWGPQLGLEESLYSKSMKTLSGGYRMRIQLQKLMAQLPNLLLLDEPTNFLDLETTLILENFLQKYKGAFLLISHDREFLKRTTDYTAEIELGEMTKFPGHIDDYFEQKRELQGLLAAQAKNQDLKRKQIQEFVDRFKAKASKARQAQSRMKMLDKMEIIETKELPVRAQIQIPKPVNTGRETLILDGLAVGFENRKVLSNIQFRLNRGDHLAVVGVNGAGKSTLLKTLAGRLPPLEGEMKWGYQVLVSYFAQHSTDELLSEESVIQAMQRKSHKEVTLQEIKNMAGSLLFNGDDIHKKIRVLSGGEKSRVALGQVLLQKNPVLLLDEPTNHLDFETVEALTQALHAYAGSVLFVSHDRGFVRRLSSKILEIKNGKAEFYPGSYDDYVWRQEKFLLSPELADPAVEVRSAGSDSLSKAQPKNSAPPVSQETKVMIRDLLKKFDTDLKVILKKEKSIEIEISQKNQLKEILIEESMMAQGLRVPAISKQLASLDVEIRDLEMSWMGYMESKEKINQEIENLKAKPKD